MFTCDVQSKKAKPRDAAWLLSVHCLRLIDLFQHHIFRAEHVAQLVDERLRRCDAQFARRAQRGLRLLDVQDDRRIAAMAL